MLERLYKAGIFINHAKCHYAKKDVCFLGYHVDLKGIAPDTSRVEPIIQYPRPKVVKELRRFLGMLNLYRQNIHGAAEYQRPLQAIILADQCNGSPFSR